MADTVKFTAELDRELLRRARLVAAKAGVTVQALLSVQLRHLVETAKLAEAARNQNFSALLAFSLGRRSGDDVMNALSIDSEEDLFLLMAHAHLPMPRLPESETRQMVELLHRSAS